MFLYPLHANSILQAHKCFDHLPTSEPIFVGGKKTIPIKTVELPCTVLLAQLEPSEIIVISSRSMLFLQHGNNGTLYRTGEHILVNDLDMGSTLIIQGTGFFYVNSGGQYFSFVKGELFVFPPGNPKHSAIVVPTSTLVVLPAGNILRKVMLCPDPENFDSATCYVVIDFQRP